MSGSSSTKIVTPNLDKWLESNAAKKEFVEWWAKYRDISSDLVLTRKISTFIAEELDLLKILYNIREFDNNILCKVAESWIRLLEKVGINRASVKRGEIQGLRSEVVYVLKKIFPLLEHYSAPVPFKGFRPREYNVREIAQPVEEKRPVKEEKTYPRYEAYQDRHVRETSRRTNDIKPRRTRYISRRSTTILKIVISTIVTIVMIFLILLFLSSVYHISISLIVGKVIYPASGSFHTFSNTVSNACYRIYVVM